MSVITLEKAKEFLGSTHDLDDALLRDLLEAAEDEALQYLDRDSLTETCEDVSSEPLSEAPLPASLRQGVLILLQANYQATPQEAEELRKVALKKLDPFRCNLGV